jgi:hypothetical protein
MKKITNTSNSSIRVVTNKTKFEIPAGNSFEVEQLQDIRNLHEIRHKILVGEDLTEVGKSSQQMLLG